MLYAKRPPEAVLYKSANYVEVYSIYIYIRGILGVMIDKCARIFISIF